MAAAAALLAKTSVGILEKHYPNWGWAVRVDDIGGVLEIRSMAFDGGKYGMLLKIRNIDPEGRAIWRAGGEYLDRFGLPRRGRRPGDTLGLKRNWKGMAVPDAG
jgi:hypothetical protein